MVVIEHEAFRNLWNAELDGGLIVEREDADKIEPGALTIFADEAKRRFDIVIPQLTRALARSDSALSQLHPARRARSQGVDSRYPTCSQTSTSSTAVMHLIDKGVIEEYEFHVPYAEDPSGVITYYTRSVAKASGVDRLSGAFATLAPMVRDYLKERVFRAAGGTGRQGHSAPAGRERCPEARRRRIRRGDPRAGDRGARTHDHRERLPGLADATVPVVSQDRRGQANTIFNLTPVDNSLEARFASSSTAQPTSPRGRSSR